MLHRSFGLDAEGRILFLSQVAMALRLLALATAILAAQAKLLIQKDAPDFELPAAMPDDQTKTVSLKDYKGKYVILFFYPFDFTFVCPTEIMAFNSVVEDLRAKGAEVLGVSTDSVHSHLAYRRLEPSAGGIGKIKFPLLSDFKKEASEAYDVLADDGSSHRGLFLIDKAGIVRHQLVNDEPLGRSVDEAVRMLDALQYFEKNGKVCPANFKGDDSLGSASVPLTERFKDTSLKTGFGVPVLKSKDCRLDINRNWD
ncbi:PRDX2 [Symbiodinium pilosum]|uniref:PRDX2 protein n=1 Tax=Symbiodinium pilosum TaxID=2952 RepID=A0A812TBQ9_SYMPI|nr:PRDX2 [Symbiodinium pilosum]